MTMDDGNFKAGIAISEDASRLQYYVSSMEQDGDSPGTDPGPADRGGLRPGGLAEVLGAGACTT